jgi:molybdopterin-guanine dinucleotide biosynthesis protein A
MGEDKALLQLGGRQLIQHALDILREAGLEARIAGARSELAAFAPVIPDAPGASELGPLGGICAALSAFTCRFAVFLPVDLPLIPSSLISYLVHHALVTEAAATVVSVSGFVQTFPAIMDRAAIESLRSSLNSGDRNCLKAFRAAGSALRGGFSVLPLELLIQPGQVRHPRALYAAQWFLNVNTPDDLRLLDKVMARTGPL